MRNALEETEILQGVLPRSTERRLKKAFATALYNRGNAYESKRDYDRAIANYTDAIAIDPKDAFAFNNRGVAYRAKGDVVRANADFAEAARLGLKDTKPFQD